MADLSRYEKIFPKDHTLFEQGEAGSRMYVIRTGRVLIYRQLDTEELALVSLGPGEFFGEMALLERQPRSASARTEERTVLIEIDEQTFQEMVRTNAEIAVRMMRKLAARVRELDRKYQRLTVERGIGRALEAVRNLARDGRVRRHELIDDLTSMQSRERYEAELLVHDLLRAGVIFAEGEELIVESDSLLDKFSRYLELREKYEGAAHEGSDVAGRMGRLLRALDKTQDEGEKESSILAQHFREYLEMKARFS